jgi:hypothetical protein
MWPQHMYAVLPTSRESFVAVHASKRWQHGCGWLSLDQLLCHLTPCTVQTRSAQQPRPAGAVATAMIDARSTAGPHARIAPKSFTQQQPNSAQAHGVPRPVPSHRHTTTGCAGLRNPAGSVMGMVPYLIKEDSPEASNTGMSQLQGTAWVGPGEEQPPVLHSGSSSREAELVNAILQLEGMVGGGGAWPSCVTSVTAGSQQVILCQHIP